MILRKDYKIIPANAEDIQWIGELESSVYFGNDVIPEDTLTGWYQANPNAFWMVISDKNKRIGHLDVLPIRAETLQKLISGSITEQEVKGSELYSPDNKEYIEDLYIESLAMNIPGKHARSRALLTVLSNFRTIAESISVPNKLNNVYAISASHEGSALLKHLGFQVLKNAVDRKDRHDLFSVSYAVFESKVKEITGQ